MRLAGPAEAPIVIVLGGISAHRRPVAAPGEADAGWWQDVLGEGGAGLLRDHRLLAIDWLGGNGDSSGPNNFGRPPAEFPEVDTIDQARLLARTLDLLGVERVAAVLSASYGGMVGLQFAALYPQRLQRLMVIGCAHRPEPMAVARRWVQKRILSLAEDGPAAREAVVLARALAMTTYRSAAEFRDRFGGPGGRESLASYLEYQGAKFADRFDRESCLRLMDSIDRHAVNPARVRTPLTLLGFDTDELCPPPLLRELAAMAPGSERLIEASSRYGHDAFLCEHATVARTIREFLQGEQP
jgi:homoserine O-acetyltransferase